MFDLSGLHVPDERLFPKRKVVFFIVLVHRNNSLHYPLRHIILGSSQPFFGLTPYCILLK